MSLVHASANHINPCRHSNLFLLAHVTITDKLEAVYCGYFHSQKDQIFRAEIEFPSDENWQFFLDPEKVFCTFPVLGCGGQV